MSKKDIPVQYGLLITQQTDTGVKTFTGWLPENVQYKMSSTFESPFQPFMDGKLAVGMRMLGLSAMSSAMTAQVWSGSSTPEMSIECKIYAENDPIKEIREPILTLLSMVTPSESSGNMGGLTDGMLIPPGPHLEGSALADAVVNEVTKINETAGSMLGGIVNSVKNYTNNSSSSTTDTSKQLNGNPIKADTWLKSGCIKNQISVQLGNLMYFPSVVVTDVDCDFPIRPHYLTGFPIAATVTISFKPLFLPTIEEQKTIFMSNQNE